MTPCYFNDIARTKGGHDEVDAMRQVAAAIEPLASDERGRVLRAAERFALPLPGQGARPGSRIETSAKGGTAEEPQDAGEFYAKAAPESEADRALVVSYWVQEVRGDGEFEAQAVNTQLKHLGHGVSNITRALDDLKARKPQLVIQIQKSGRTLVLLRAVRNTLEQAFSQLRKPLSSVAEPQVYIADGGPDRSNAHWYKFEVVKSANEGGKFANFTEDHYFVKASMRVERERLVFVTSFHHIGRDLSGIMEATAFARLEAFEESDDREYASQDFFLCSLEPFVFTYRTTEQEIADSFDRWLDAAVAVAFKEYGDRL